MPMSDRFSADEARRIFSRAARRQHVAPSADGLTVADLEAIGREAGLDPALVAAEAVAERAGQADQETWHGVPVGIQRARLMPARISDGEWERVVDLLRAEYRTPGTAEQIGRRREWAGASPSSSSISVRVRVEERSEGDLVTVEVPDTYRLMGRVLGGTFGGIGLGFGALIGTLQPEKVGAALAVAVALVALAAVLYGSFLLSAKLAAARTPDRLEGLLDRIDLISRLDAAQPVLAGCIDPVHLGAEAEDVPVPSARPRART